MRPRRVENWRRRDFARKAPFFRNLLTTRESDILRLIASGLANKEIGVKLQLSEKTIKNYVSRILSKLNVSDRTQAVVYAIKAGFV